MSTRQALEDHLSLCDEVHALYLEENRLYDGDSREDEEAVLERKRALLARLEASLETLRTINRDRPDDMRQAGSLVNEARNRLMRMLVLDRENERKLLKRGKSFPAGAQGRSLPPGPIRR